MVRIAEIGDGSIADALELRIGSRILKVNGARVRDGIDFAFLTAEEELRLEVLDPDGTTVVCEISRDPSESLGIVPAPDTIRECANECVFCFIDGNPPGARDPLWLRDDDFRLSFTYGSYVTLTNLGPRGLQRLVDQRLSPLYVSVHATNPELRVRLLKNDRAGLIMDQLRFLLDGGLEVHAQAVLCPDWNDGEELDRTIRELYALGDGILSLSVVPVGLTRYNLNRPVRLLRPGEAVAAIAQTEPIRERALRRRGKHWCYAADELFLIGGCDVPEAGYYDDWPLLENGVGALRNLIDGFRAGAHRLGPAGDVRRIRVVTGTSMRPWFEGFAPSISTAMRCPVEVVAIENRYFGPSVTVAGLLAGDDILRGAQEDTREGDLVLLPATALNDDRVFIDGVAFSEVAARLAPARVRTGYQVVETLLGDARADSAAATGSRSGMAIESLVTAAEASAGADSGGLPGVASAAAAPSANP